MKPFKGEVVDGKVVNVNKVSEAGSLRRLSTHLVCQMGFFAMVGPLQVFVSSHVSLQSESRSPTLHTPPPFVMNSKHRDIIYPF